MGMFTCLGITLPLYDLIKILYHIFSDKSMFLNTNTYNKKTLFAKAKSHLTFSLIVCGYTKETKEQTTAGGNLFFRCA